MIGTDGLTATLKVVKRSGQRVEFNASKIALAIKKAFDSILEESDEKQVYKIFEKVLSYINANYRDRKTISVEDIQDIIEKILKEEKVDDVYKAFQEYRKKRAASRKAFNEKQQHKFVKAIEKVQEESSRENTEYLQPYQILNRFGKIISSEYTKSYVIDNKIVKTIEEGNIYVHELETFSLGFIPRVNLKLTLKDDYSLDDLISELINAQFEVSEEIGINSLDILLKDYILKRYRLILKKYLKRYLNLFGFLEVINTKKYEDAIDHVNDLDDSFQILKGFMINDSLKNVFKRAIEDAIADTKEIINLTINKLFDTIINNHREKIIFNISIGSSDLEIVSLINDSVIEYLNCNNRLAFIHVIFKIRPDTSYEYISRIISLIINHKNISLATTKTDDDCEYFSNGYKVYDNVSDNRSSIGRMILATTSINLSRLAMKNSQKTLNEFYTDLEQVVEIAKNQLLLQFETIGDKNSENYQTLFKGNIVGDEKLDGNQRIRKVIKNGSLNLGIIGLKECVLVLEKDEGKQYDLAIDIINRINQLCQRFGEEFKITFSLCEPSEIEARKELIAIDKSIYGFNKKITDKETYELIDSLKAVKNDYRKLAQIQKLFTGGRLTKIAISSKTSNKKIQELIQMLIEEDIGYVNLEILEK